MVTKYKYGNRKKKHVINGCVYCAVAALGGKQGKQCLPYNFLNLNFNVGILHLIKNKCEVLIIKFAHRSQLFLISVFVPYHMSLEPPLV